MLPNYPTNIWLITESEFDQFVFSNNGGMVIYIAEEINPRFINHPCIIPSNILNPPVQAVQAELDGNLEQANFMYDQYLMSEDIEVFVRIIMAACIKRTPIAIMFGRDEVNMQSSSMFINFLFKRYGIVVGINGKLNPYIDINHIPEDLAIMYCTDMIDYPAYMCMHPDLPIAQISLPKLIVDVNPYVIDKSFAGYLDYFERKKNSCREYGTFIIDPLMGV